ncbi:MAG: hypothetical protein ACERLM_04470, partial [Acidimicrobiales bacterium]
MGAGVLDGTEVGVVERDAFDVGYPAELGVRAGGLIVFGYEGRRVLSGDEGVNVGLLRVGNPT